MALYLSSPQNRAVFVGHRNRDGRWRSKMSKNAPKNSILTIMQRVLCNLIMTKKIFLQKLLHMSKIICTFALDFGYIMRVAQQYNTTIAGNGLTSASVNTLSTCKLRKLHTDK